LVAENHHPPVISAIVGGVVVWFVQEQGQRRQKETDIASCVAILVANDLRDSIEVGETMRQRLMKRTMDQEAATYSDMYSAMVNLPASMDTAILKPVVIAELDKYRRVLADCAKDHQLLVDAWRENSPPPNAKKRLFIYCPRS